MGPNKRSAQDVVGAEAAMYAYKRKRLSLMPALALAALSALVAIPAFSQVRLFAAGAQHPITIVVHPGENLWSIADRYTATDGNTQETVDAIKEANHMKSSSTVPGERLLVPR